MKQKFTFTLSLVLAVSTLFGQGLFISEVADPGDHWDGRFVELYNASSATIDFSTTVMYLSKQSNGGSTWSDVQLTGTVAPGACYVIAADAEFTTYYPSVTPDMTDGTVSSNGDDAYFLYAGGDHTTGTLYDIYGAIDTDGTGEAWEFLDGRGVRTYGIVSPNTTWTASEWTVTMPANTSDMTPGTHSVTAPAGPEITNISATPWSPTSSETVNVSATITDDVSVAGAVLYWSLTSPVTDADNSITMAVTSGDDYATSTAIPAQANGATVYYIIVASDGDANVTTSSEESYTVVDSENHTISEIQTPTDISVSDASPYMDVKVTTTGIIYAVAPYGYYIQDGDGAWNGILVYDNQNSPSLGDEVTISGFVKEYYTLTEISPVSAFAVNSSANTLPAVTVLSTADAAKEDYEGVLIQVKGAFCTNDDAGYGMWEVDDDSGALLVDDDMYSYTPALNVKYNITGAATYTYGDAKILPRNASDIEDATDVKNIKNAGISVYPNPSNGVFNIKVENNYNLEVSDITGRVINTRTLTGNTSIELNTSGIYFFKFSNDKESYIQKVIVK